MIKTLLLTTALTLSVTATAGEKQEQANCKLDAMFAQIIMESRQVGVPLMEVMDIVSEPQKDMTLRAYEYPQYPEGYRKPVVTEFQNTIYLECLQENQG